MLIYNLQQSQIQTKMIKFLQILIGILSIESVIGYSAQITMKSTASTSSITDYFIDFAECSCNIMPLICDNYCCCDSLCGSSVTTWAANYQCLTTSSAIQVPCGQSTKGFGAIEDLTCVYYSNRGRIGYYYSSTSSTSQTVSKYSLSAKIEKPQVKQKQLITALSLSNGYTFANQYIKASTSDYLYLPFAGIGGNCVPGLVNFTASGTYYCKIIATPSNCPTINEAYAGLTKICTQGDCSADYSLTGAVSPSTSGNSTCDNIIKDFTLTAILGYNTASGRYSLLNTVFGVNKYNSVNFGTEVQVKVVITLGAATQQKSGNPGYIIGKPVSTTNQIGLILSTSTGECQISSTGTLSIPFATNTIYSCPSPSPCNATYYIDTLSTILSTVNKYASLTQTISVVKSTTLGCKAQTFTLSMLYSHNGWALDPQYYIVGAMLSDKGTSDGSNPTKKYLKIDWLYVDPTNVTTPPSNNFYSYFSYLWTPLKQKFGMS